MVILRDQGTFEILELPNDPIQIIAKTARTCYQSFDKDNPEANIKLVKNLLKRGHFAMIEFGDMTVKFTKISRGFTHEMVRHRLCSFAQESTRYVDESELSCVIPPHKSKNEIVRLTLPGGRIIDITVEEWFDLNEQMYRGLRIRDWKPEDARQVLPIGMANEIVVKANLREWIHIFKMRTAKSAHWEIRGVMCNLLLEVQTKIPLIYDNFEPMFNSTADAVLKNISHYEYKPYED